MKNSVLVKTLPLVLAALAALAPRAAAQSPAAPGGVNADDERAVREAVRQMEAGWNTKSGAAFAKPFAEDADYVVVNGMQIKGRDAIDKGHQRIFDTIYKDSSLALTLKQVRFLRPDVAVAHVAARLKVRHGEQTQEGDAIITTVLTKDKGEWRIAAFQNTGVSVAPGRPAN